ESAARLSSRQPRPLLRQRSLRREPPQHILKDAARAEIFELVVSVDAAAGGEAKLVAVVAADLHLDVLPGLQVGYPVNRVFLGVGEAEARRILPVAELE